MKTPALLAVAVAAAALTACASSTDGSSGGSGADSTAARELAAIMQKGIASARSLHITLSVTTAGKKVTGTGDEKLSGGKLTAMRIDEHIGGQGLAVVVVDKTVYLKLPPQVSTSTKPWVKVTADSSNPLVRQIAPSIQSTLSSASVSSLDEFAKAAKSVTDEGPAQVDGQSVRHYALVLDVTKVSADLPNGAAIQQSGLKTLPVDLYLDDQGRPVRMTEKFAVSGQTVQALVALSRYNQPVAVSAPPASEVSSG